ncbi:uncharacterized protein RJT20DRAFT_127887 [Scheffersomyces xylosifermentans]|uniref:uncharacterized protein n=1 Tax=Scheffersomyces xylosifermentans TaxID=1304137 RepID=UPI00315C7A12
MNHPGVNNNHFSTSSSVYSPIDSEYGFKPNAQYTPIQEESDDEAASLESYIAENNENISINSRDRKDPALNPDMSTQTFNSYVTARGIDSSESGESDIEYENITGGAPSFTSINESLMRDNALAQTSRASFDSKISINGNRRDQNNNDHYDNDETPKLNYASRNDPLDDKTPILGVSNGFDREKLASIDNSNFSNPTNNTLSNPISNPLARNKSISAKPTTEVPSRGDSLHRAGSDRSAVSPLLPQQELSSKFQRLSVTLQQSTTSGDSYNFMNSFQQNVQKINQRNSTTRTSKYYKKIHEPQPKDEIITDEGDRRLHNNDAASVVSTISNSSSIISQSSEIGNDRTRSTPPDINLADGQSTRKKSTTSSTSFHFDNINTNNGYSNERRIEEDPEVVDSPGVPPLKIVKKASSDSVAREIPVRRDLVHKYEDLSSITSTKNSTREKNDLFVSNSRSGLDLPQPNGLNISLVNSATESRNFSDSHTDTNTSSEGLGISEFVLKKTAAASSRDSTTSLPQSSIGEDEDLSSLFIRALHPFDSTTLQSESDASICLSFEKDDLAFVHTIDDSGWGEVTLVDSLQRGWIPMNYFTIAVSDEDDLLEDEEEETRIPNSRYLKPLFHSCGKFLMNPLSHRNRRGKYTFSIRVINSIRDGVRLLLQQTDCLSRSNEIVTKRPIVRKSRKSLLADWYNLMVKANEFKGTSNFNKIEILTLMIYQVTRKATNFLQIWSIESKQIIKRENEKKLQEDLSNYPLLPSPPLAKQRITEINGILYSYLGLIIGRLDLIEHNSVGCDLLETLAHQIILLLRELLFISKTGSDFSSEKPADLDSSLDTLLSLVSDLVSGVKNLVVKTLNESEADRKSALSVPNALGTDYYYTQEGGDLIQIGAKMVKSISVTVTSIRKLLDVTGDFRLSAGRSYPDYTKMKIEPEDFIRKCSAGIQRPAALTASERSRPTQRNPSSRYSLIRSGKTGELGLTLTGANLLQDSLGQDGDSPFSISNAAFEPYTSTSDAETNINDELLVDSNGNLLGASFKGLIHTLTNENSPPEYFFVSTLFICFRSFANGIDLIEELITRFDMGNKSLEGQTKADISGEVRLKKRRKLIVKMFQLWMESYWNQELDYSLLTTLINFFNEGVSLYLPLDAMRLIEIGAKLSTRPLIENQKSTHQGTRKQLLERSITITRSKRKTLISSGDTSLNTRYSMVDGYELSKINTNSSTASSLKSMTLPMPLGIGNQTSSSNSLLTARQLNTIEKVILTYRAILGDSWCSQKYVSDKEFIPLSLNAILPYWFSVFDQSWVLSNYRPNLLDFNGLELAKQLTNIESHIFCAIKPDELLNENFSTKRAHLKLAPNVRQSLLFTNSLSGYVLESILQPKINQKLRVNMVKTWLKVAISCLYLRNFNSLAAIITALQSHLVTRLTKVWGDLSDKYRELYDYLSGIIRPEKNYSIYRSKLRNFLISNDYNIPIVPYFSLFLQDLTFVTDGNTSYRKANTFLNQKLINIDKYLKITRIIADIESLQIPYVDASTQKEMKRNSMSFMSNSKLNEVEDYSIVPVPALQELILLELWKVSQLNKAEEDRAWKLSCLIQPRDANS